MKKRLQGFLAGAIVMFVLFNSFTYAATIGETITAYMNSVKIALDGDVVTTIGQGYQLSNGTTVPYSILYNGTTYIPIRKFCELLEKEIGYDDNTRTVLIGESGAIVEKNVWKLVDKDFVNGKDDDTYYHYGLDSTEQQWKTSVSAEDFYFETLQSWSDMPTVIRPDEKISITLSNKLGEFIDPKHGYAMGSHLYAYWGYEMTRPYDRYDIAGNRYYLSEEYSTNYGNDRREAVVGVNDSEQIANISPLEVYFIAPEAGYSDDLYIVVRHYGLGGLIFYQYTYEWQD